MELQAHPIGRSDSQQQPRTGPFTSVHFDALNAGGDVCETCLFRTAEQQLHSCFLGCGV